MNNGGYILLISKDIEYCLIQPIYKFKKPEFEKIGITLPIIFDETKNTFILIKEESLENEEDDIFLNNQKVQSFPAILTNGDILTYKGYNFRLNLFDLEKKILFESFWYENLYLGNLPVFSAKAFEKLIEIEIYKAKRYQYPFSMVLIRFNQDISQKSKEIEKIICENIRFSDMLCQFSNYEYLLYLLQVKEENIGKIIEKIKNLLNDILDLNIYLAKGIEFNQNIINFQDILINLYCK